MGVLPTSDEACNTKLVCVRSATGATAQRLPAVCDCKRVLKCKAWPRQRWPGQYVTTACFSNPATLEKQLNEWSDKWSDNSLNYHLFRKTTTSLALYVLHSVYGSEYGGSCTVYIAVSSSHFLTAITAISPQRPLTESHLKSSHSQRSVAALPGASGVTNSEQRGGNGGQCYRFTRALVYTAVSIVRGGRLWTRGE